MCACMFQCDIDVLSIHRQVYPCTGVITNHHMDQHEQPCDKTDRLKTNTSILQ